MTRRAHGFTLIEVVVATALLAILMTLAIVGVRTITRASAAGTAAIDRSNKLRVTQEFLRRELMQALVAPFEQEQGTGRSRVFIGMPERMVFVAPMPGYLGHGGAYVQELTLARADRGQRLEFRHALLNGYMKDDAKKVGEGEPVVLMEGIERLEFAYRGMSDTGQWEDWKDSWSATDRRRCWSGSAWNSDATSARPGRSSWCH